MGERFRETEVVLCRLSNKIGRLSGKMSNSNSSPLDPRVKRTRHLLQEAFRSLRKERPAGEISVVDVTRRAGVNRATFYAHFTDIHHFATDLLRENFDLALREGISQSTPMNSETLTGFGTAVFGYIDQFNQNSGRLDSDKELNIAHIFQETIQNFLASWVGKDRAAMQLFPNSTPENAATALAWALYGGATRWSRLHPRPAAEQAAREIVALLVH